MADTFNAGLGDKLDDGQLYPVQDETIEDAEQKAWNFNVQNLDSTDEIERSKQAKYLYNPISTEFRTYDEALASFSHLRKKKVTGATSAAIINFTASMRWTGDTFPCSFDSFDGAALLKRVKAHAKAVEQDIEEEHISKRNEKEAEQIKIELTQEKTKLWDTLRERLAVYLKKR